jgi:Trk-type K+ transport system membrane component
MEASFIGVLSTFSKLVMCIVMIMGRHRGLPHSLDAAGTLFMRLNYYPAIHKMYVDLEEKEECCNFFTYTKST